VSERAFGVDEVEGAWPYGVLYLWSIESIEYTIREYAIRKCIEYQIIEYRVYGVLHLLVSPLLPLLRLKIRCLQAE
jgi:hypothetical protein